MKWRLIILAVTSTALTTLGPRNAQAAVEVSAGIQINATADFNAPLTPYGTWVDYRSYGRCWRPTHVEADWRPYGNGSWEWTDAGWYWQSEEPWAWACYHYGSWEFDTGLGWVWIPATDWSPAWVTWRSSDDYIGWAPCGPGLVVLAPAMFTFCDVHHFRDHFRPHDLIINNTTIINRTKVVTKDFHRESVDFGGSKRTVFANKGPGVDSIQRATGTKFTPKPVRDVVRETRLPENLGRNEGQRPTEPNRQPEPQRLNNDQHRDTPPPTGKEQPRVFQQPEPKAPQAPKPNIDRPKVNPTTGREEPRLLQKPEPKTPELPKERKDIVPPTGREQPRIYHETPNPNPPAEQRKEVPTPAPRAITPPERPLAPTGREEAPRVEHREIAPQAPARVAPAPQAPADGHDRDGHRDGN